MGMTKTYYHDQICAMFDQHQEEDQLRQEAEYQAWVDWREEQDEKETDWFPEYKLAHDGYEEIVPEAPRVLIDDDIPF